MAHDLPGFPEELIGSPQDVVSHNGYITVNEQEDAKLFYWCFESQNDPVNDPFAIWLTGGPGCSSILALLFENGPYTVNTDMTLSPNPYTWNQNATVCWVDQPVGTGFSVAKNDYVHDEAQVEVEMFSFIQDFLNQYPQYQPNPFFLFGESYGGHYVPSVSAYIVQNNGQSGNVTVNYQGSGVGNGWVSPITQFGAYSPFSVANNLISETQASRMNSTYTQCQALLKANNLNQAYDVCESIMQVVLSANPGLNYYNIDAKCDGPLCYDFDAITKYLNLKATQQQLGVDVEWQACNDNVNEGFAPVDTLESFATDVPTVLDAGQRVLVYSGMLDLICNYFGGAEWLSQTAWSGQSAFNAESLSDWTLTDGTTGGETKTYQGLTWLQVETAGHMVPHDQPAAAQEMFNTFVSNGSF
eukprot:TRINITY_DN16730_c0_g1_i1.p1 TRINITY_DN16730_c0_g1~~TRINITY_DN16730_c0_g1_i1.p1  ORF type:complete len:443 (-),score=137.95 TRINITY_DN16730_c0_g1_i1:184-1425(-)